MNKLHNEYQTIIENFDESVQWLVEALPHGAGVNGTWEVNSGEFSDYVYLVNSYQVMSEMGYYVGWQDFRIRIDKVDFISLVRFYTRFCYLKGMLGRIPENKREVIIAKLEKIASEFTLQFAGGSYLARYYDLRPYLEDTIAYSLTYWAIESLNE
jgi:hypothetical protein